MGRPKRSVEVEFTGDSARFGVEGQYISVPEAAAILRLSEISIRRLLWKKQLKRYKAGGRTLVARDQVLGLIHEA